MNLDVKTRLQELLGEARRYLSISRGKVVYRDRRGFEVVESIKDLMVEYYIGSPTLMEVSSWITAFNKLLEDTVKVLGGRGWSFPREFKSFTLDPRAHLKKKLFNYTFDLLRGRIAVEEYMSKSRQALASSLRSNVRSLYQFWVFLGIIRELGSLGARIVYPEYGFIVLDRSGRQKTGSIPPNLVLNIEGRGELSFFIEAPRPLGWEDTRDLSMVWRLYVSLRPDILVYSGRVMDIVDLTGDIPIRRPNVIIECKEMPDWYKRSRILKGSIAKPLTAEEWMSRWIRGLWEGLGEALGVSREQLGELIEKSRGGIRVSEVELILLYKETYKPDAFILVSQPKLDRPIKLDLETRGVIVVDGVGIGERGRVRELSEILLEYAKPEEWDPVDTVKHIVSSRLGRDVERRLVEEALLELALTRIDEVIELVNKLSVRGEQQAEIRAQDSLGSSA